MLQSFITRTVDFCTRRPRPIVFVAFLLAVACGLYVAFNFAIDANVNDLLSSKLPWRQRELAYQAAFPQEGNTILVVVEAPTPELTEKAADTLVQGLSAKPHIFRSVQEEGGGSFYRRNGLLFLPTEEVARTAEQLSGAEPIIGALTSDPSLRGLTEVLSIGLGGVRSGKWPLDDLARPLNMAADTLDAVSTNKQADFSWKALLQGNQRPADLRRIIIVLPVLDEAQLQPGQKATSQIRGTVGDLELAAKFQATVRLTGPVPIADEEFGSLQQGLWINSLVTGAVVLIILWLALHSLRLVFAVVVTLGIGLVVTAGLGLVLVGTFNPISLAFAVLFVGLGADFAIQYGVRYRAMRYRYLDLHRALVNTAERVGVPLTLAALAAAAGFLSFVPTSYTGLAQLGSIAGLGMAVAYVAALTLLPALIQVMNPPREAKPLRQPGLAPADDFLSHHRILVVTVTSLIVLAHLPALTKLQFDFNPLHLRNKNSEAVATLRELEDESMITANTAEVLKPSEAGAELVGKQLAALPEVAQTRTISSFIPSDQDRKLALIGNADRALAPALGARQKPAPADPENVAALRSAGDNLRQAADQHSGPGADAARRLATQIDYLADSDATLRSSATSAFSSPLQQDLDDLRQALRPQRVTRSSLPPEIVRAWVAPDGRARAEAIPKGDANDNETLHAFARAVLKAQPDATGAAIEIFEWGDTIIWAFIEAAVLAFLAIGLLLWVVLRCFSDVLRTLVPLMVAALATLEICAMTNFPLNYANVIALPVLLGVGVAFKIYYVMAWRNGQTEFLQSALTRAVFFSALLTATAFGSLWLSSHPGTSSMGKLLALSLACTLVSAVLFQPALMGPPRRLPVEPRMIGFHPALARSQSEPRRRVV